MAVIDEILSNAQGPKSVRSDSGSVDQHPLQDQIAADKYLTGEDAVASERRGMRISRLVPPGCT